MVEKMAGVQLVATFLCPNAKTPKVPLTPKTAEKMKEVNRRKSVTRSAVPSASLVTFIIGSLRQLVDSRSNLGELWTIWKGLRVSCEGLGASWKPEGGMERDGQTDKMELSRYGIVP